MDSPKHRPIMFMLAGPNGAGKSTLYEAVIKPRIDAPFINADIIQRDELKNLDVNASYEAAQIAEQRRQAHLREGKSFVSESTFSHKSKLDLVNEAKKAGFRVVMYHVNVRSPELSVARVASRVTQGGHAVPEEKIRARYERNQEIIKSAVLASEKGYIYDNSVKGKPPTLAISFHKGIADRVSGQVPAWARSLYASELNRYTDTKLNPAAASYSDIKKMAESFEGKETKVSIPSPKEPIYKGEIVGESSLHYLQKTDSGDYVGHFKDVFKHEFSLGIHARISYQTRYKATAVSVTSNEQPTEKKAELAAAYYGKKPQQALKEHPELKGVYEARDAANIMAQKKKLLGETKNQFVSAVEDQALTMAAAGKEVNLPASSKSIDIEPEV